jgi:intraflagellar transport protein 57
MEEEDEGVNVIEPEVLMEDIIEYLKLINYEGEFCSERGLKPLSKCYFAVKINPSEQFMYFVTLVSWLLTLWGQSSGGWNQYDDPNTVTNNIVLDLKKLDILIDYPPSKLKSGSGEAVCQALHGLVQVALKAQKFKFRTPVIPEDDEGDDGGEMGDDNMEGNADIADLVGNEMDDDDDIAELVETGANDLRANDFENPDNAIIEAAIDPDEWYREWQRVAHKLKIKESHDAQEWRSHLDQTKKYAESVQQSLPDVRSKLEKIADEVGRALEKIIKKESIFKTRHDTMTDDYKQQAVRMKENTEEFNRLTNHVQELESELYDIEEKLADIKKKMDENQNKISDSSPLLKIKKGITKVKNDIRSIEIRIGVVSNTLLQLKLKERTAKDEKPKMGANDEDDDMDLEI